MKVKVKIPKKYAGKTVKIEPKKKTYIIKKKKKLMA